MTLSCALDPARARALQAALGDPATLDAGDPLPPFAHQIYFWDPQPPAALGRDGHPATGGFMPDLGLPRRMWAGGELVFHAPLRAGIKARKESRIESVTRKSGRSGPLGFVRVRHDIVQRGALCVTEWQDIVYREDDAPSAAPVPARTDEEIAIPFAPDSTLLFRYSALTFNGHRIHYDADYARTVEGCAGLVVHGPLLAYLLMLLAESRAPLTRFVYRARGPLILPETAAICAKGPDLWVRAADGRLCMEGRAG